MKRSRFKSLGDSAQLVGTLEDGEKKKIQRFGRNAKSVPYALDEARKNSQFNQRTKGWTKRGHRKGRKKKRKRCERCKKKLLLVQVVIGQCFYCKNFYCKKHGTSYKTTESSGHLCLKYDLYKHDVCQELKKQNPKVTSLKVLII